VINQNTFEIQEIYTTHNTVYQMGKNNIIKISSSNLKKEYSKKYLAIQKILLLHKITIQKKSKGSFEIDEIKPLIEDLLDGNKFKGSYNIKSNLGAKATLLKVL